jgi:hypothetical protein
MRPETEKKIWDAYRVAENEKSEYVSSRTWGGPVLPPGGLYHLVQAIIKIVKEEEMR